MTHLGPLYSEYLKNLVIGFDHELMFGNPEQEKIYNHIVEENKPEIAELMREIWLTNKKKYNHPSTPQEKEEGASFRLRIKRFKGYGISVDYRVQ